MVYDGLYSIRNGMVWDAKWETGDYRMWNSEWCRRVNWIRLVFVFVWWLGFEWDMMVWCNVMYKIGGDMMGLLLYSVMWCGKMMWCRKWGNRVVIGGICMKRRVLDLGFCPGGLVLVWCWKVLEGIGLTWLGIWGLGVWDRGSFVVVGILYCGGIGKSLVFGLVSNCLVWAGNLVG